MNRSLSQPALPEFVAMMALLTSLVALSIDTMLPALAMIGADLGVSDLSHTQLIVSLLFMGLGIGQLFYGPLSDSIGRKNAIYVGVSIFIAGTLLSLFAPDFNTMLAGRVLQGVGAASARIVTMAMIRDQHAGRSMARIMSFIMAVFIIVPVLAPAIGQAILYVADWHGIFVFFLILSIGATTWFGLRLPESLTPERRRPFSARVILAGFRECFGTRVTFGYTVATGFVLGPFLGYLSTAQQIFQVQYGAGEMFVVYFGMGAVMIGFASVLNSQMVMRLGMRRISRLSLGTAAGVSVLFALYTALLGQPPLAAFMLYVMVTFFCMGTLFGNMNAIALEPMGHMAGVGSAFVGFFSTSVAVIFGTVVGQNLGDTVLAVVLGFAIMPALALALSFWADRGTGHDEAEMGMTARP